MRIFVSYSLALDVYVRQISSLFAAADISLVGSQAPGITTASIELVSKSDVFLCLIADSSPNVFFELGYAMNTRTPIVIAVYGDVVLPIDIAGLRYVRLTGELQVDYTAMLKLVKEAAGSDIQPVQNLHGDELIQVIKEDLYRVEELTPIQFEELVAKLYENKGLAVQRVSSGGKDSGYDLLALDRTLGSSFVIQCKKMSRQSLVSVSTVHQILENVSKNAFQSAVIVSNVPYTAAAKALAEQQGISLLKIQDLL